MESAMKTLASILLLSMPAFAELRTDIEFASKGDVRLTLDAYVPEGAGPFPAVIVVHGGGFTRGDKQTFVKPLFEPLSRGGFAWFTINYRLAPAYRFPAAVEDVESAVEYVKTHAKQYKADSNRIALVGESAGGHLVSFAGTRKKPNARVAAVVSFYGPHDLASRARSQRILTDSIKAFLGLSELNDESFELLRKASPITRVFKDMPPYLLIHGTKDDLVPYDQSVLMCEKMKQAGARCEIFTVEGGAHGVGSWERIPEFQAYKQKMVNWLHTTLGY
jgi:acetyl esterase